MLLNLGYFAWERKLFSLQFKVLLVYFFKSSLVFTDQRVIIHVYLKKFIEFGIEALNFREQLHDLAVKIKFGLMLLINNELLKLSYLSFVMKLLPR